MVIWEMPINGEGEMGNLFIPRKVIYLNWMARRLLILPFLLLLITVSQTTDSRPPGISAVQATWLYGKVATASRISKKGYLYRYPPGSDPWLPILEKRLKPGAVAPAVIWLHGCSGQSRQTTLAIGVFQVSGYTVFAPDSLARPRGALCDTGGMDYRIYMRHEEVKYALSQIRTFPWVDQKHLVLAGFSEGGNAAAEWGGPEFKAHVLIGTDCGYNGGSSSAPDGVRVLNMVGSLDRYGRGVGCRLTKSQLSNGSMVKSYSDLGHSILQSYQVRRDLAAFMKSLNP